MCQTLTAKLTSQLLMKRNGPKQTMTFSLRQVQVLLRGPSTKLRDIPQPSFLPPVSTIKNLVCLKYFSRTNLRTISQAYEKAICLIRALIPAFIKPKHPPIHQIFVLLQLR